MKSFHWHEWSPLPQSSMIACLSRIASVPKWKSLHHHPGSSSRHTIPMGKLIQTSPTCSSCSSYLFSQQRRKNERKWERFLNFLFFRYDDGRLFSCLVRVVGNRSLCDFFANRPVTRVLSPQMVQSSIKPLESTTWGEPKENESWQCRAATQTSEEHGVTVLHPKPLCWIFLWDWQWNDSVFHSFWSVCQTITKQQFKGKKMSFLSKTSTQTVALMTNQFQMPFWKLCSDCQLEQQMTLLCTFPVVNCAELVWMLSVLLGAQRWRFLTPASDVGCQSRLRRILLWERNTMATREKEETEVYVFCVVSSRSNNQSITNEVTWKIANMKFIRNKKFRSDGDKVVNAD